MATYSLKAQTFRDAASGLRAAIEEFQTAWEQRDKVGNQLIENWEGGTQVKFATEHEHVRQWYTEIISSAEQLAQKVEQIAQEYETADEEAAKEI